MDKRTCPQCGNDVVQKPRGRERIYCTDECRALAQTVKRGGTPIPRSIRTCPVDGTEFSAAGTKKYCTPKCYRRAMNHAQRLREGGTTIALDAPLARPFDCSQCGKACAPGENVAPHASKFCGQECKAIWHHVQEGSDVGSRSAEARDERRYHRYVERLTTLRGLDVAAYKRALRRDPCAYCGAPGEALDHVEPKSSRGQDDWTNRTSSCHSCNSLKGSLSLLAALPWIPVATEYHAMRRALYATA